MLRSDRFVCLASSIASLPRSSGVARRVAAVVEIAGEAELPFVVVVVAEMQFHESRSAAAAATTAAAAVSKSPLL